MKLEFLLLLFLVPLFHWVGDFVCQPREMATKKGKDNMVLLNHVMIYTYICLLPIAWFAWYAKVISTLGVVIFVLLNVLAHYVTDYITSRYNEKYYAADDMKRFWRTVGLDQTIHMWFVGISLACCYYITHEGVL